MSRNLPVSSPSDIVQKYKRLPGIQFEIAINADGRMLFHAISQGFLDAGGFSEKEVIGHDPDEVLPSPCRTSLREHIRNAFKTKRTQTWEERSFFSANEQTHEVTLVPHIGPSGKCSTVSGLVQDITARKKAEEEALEKTHDLELLKTLNEAAVNNDSFHQFGDMLTTRLRDVFANRSVNMYMVSPDQNFLTLENLLLESHYLQMILNIVGEIPPVRIPLINGSFYQRILIDRQIRTLSGKDEILEMIYEHTSDKALRKLIPLLFSTLNLKYITCIPLYDNEVAIGAIQMAHHEPLSDKEKTRLQSLTIPMAGLIKLTRLRSELTNVYKRFLLATHSSKTLVWEITGHSRELRFINSDQFPELALKSYYNNTRDAEMWVHPDDLPLVKEALTRHLEGKNSQFICEHRVIFPDGSHTWVATRGQAQCVESTDEIIVAGTSTDISDNRKLRDEISLAKEQAEKNSVLLEESLRVGHAGTFSIDLQNGNWTSSQSLDDILGIGPDYPKTFDGWVSLIHPDDRIPTRNHLLNQIQAKKRSVTSTCRIVRSSDGESRWVQGIGKTERKNGQYILLYGIIQDITERRQVEAALSESEERFRTLSEDALPGVYIIEDNRLVYVNPAMEKLFGYGPGELTGADPMDIIHPDDRELVRENIRRRIGGEIKVMQYQIRGIQKDGVIRYMEVLGSRTMLNKRPVIIGNVLDITERKKVEAALRESENRNRSLVNAMPDLMFVISPDGTFLDYKGHRDNLFLQPEQFIGKQISGVMPAQLTEKCLNIITGRAGIGLHTFEYELLLNGTIHNYEARADFNPAMSETVFVIRDITERKKTEDGIRKMSRAIEQSPVSIVITDPEGNLEYVNPKFCEVTGYTAEEALGQNPRILKSGDHSDAYYRELWETIRSGNTWVGEFHNKKKNGDLFWERSSISPIRNSCGQITHFVGVKEDITEAKRAQSVIQRLNAELEQRVIERTSQLESFSYSVSHDLRAPLRAVNSFAQILKNEYESVLDVEGKRLLDTITSEACHMGKLIDDLLQFSRLGQKDLAMVSVNMDHLVKEVIESLTLEAGSRSIDWRVKRLPVIPGDHSLLRQVWQNLLNNALKYSRTRQEAVIEVGCSRKSDTWVFYVKDNGVGFDTRYSHQLFKVFQRLHSPAEFEGSGIGLANVQRIVQKHGGTVWAEARPGEGAVFYFSLPKVSPGQP